MNSGEPSAQKPTAAERIASRAVPKKASRATKSAAGMREPRVSVSKTGAAARRSASSTAVAGEDILDRLARLGESTVADPLVNSAILPMIVEADPTYPPLSVPAAARAGDESDESEESEESEESTDTTGMTRLAVGVDVTADNELDVDLEPRPPRHDGAAPILDLVLNRTTSLVSPDSAVSADVAIALIPIPAVTPIGLVPPSPEIPAVEALTALPEHTLLVPRVPTESLPLHDSPIIGTDETTGFVLPKRPLRAPMVFRRAKPRVRRVTRVVRHVDTWSVFKVALVFNVILYLVCLTSGVLLWNVAHATGTVDNVEKFFEQFGWESFEFKGGEIYHNGWIGGLFAAVGLTGFAVLLATLFNLITDLVGGIRVSVLEEEVLAKPRTGPNAAASTDSTSGVPRP